MHFSRENRGVGMLGHGVKGSAYWASNTTGIPEMERRHLARMAGDDPDFRPREPSEELLTPEELLARIWDR
jgi:hypothetical protein